MVTAEVIEDMWTNLSLIDNEVEEGVVDHEWIEETLADGRNCTIGKVLTRRVVNMEAMKIVQFIFLINLHLIS